MTVKILGFSGSSRTDSINVKLVQYALSVAKNKGADVTFVDLKKDVPMPLFDQDLEASSGLPTEAKDLKALMTSHDAFFVASPEYNSSFSPLLKNAIDWTSRPHTENETALSAYTGKVVGLMACSPGGLGGLRGLFHIRDVFQNINAMVVPQMAAIGNGFTAFDDEGNLIDPAQKAMVETLVDQVIKAAK